MTAYVVGDYALTVSTRSDHVIEIRKEDGTIYYAALSDGHVVLCTCKGFHNRFACKHVPMIYDALNGDGIPFQTYGRLRNIPGQGIVREGARDPFARIAGGTGQ